MGSGCGKYKYKYKGVHLCMHMSETIIVFFECSDIMPDQVYAWTDIGQDKSDMETLRSLCSQSFQFFSIIEHNSCITSY